MANRLAAATSPYLLQHADNPVDWWQWGPDAVEEARRRDVPIFLSVGYAACHWCHVMAHESFEDPATARVLNERFVCIKVDREERPDIDAVYMAATTALTGHGGWPMSVWLDHEGRAFHAGTYYPPRSSSGMPSFTDVLAAVWEAWSQRRSDLLAAAGRINAVLAQREGLPPKGVPAEPADSVLAAACEVLIEQHDDVDGGFGGAPKFPPSMVLPFLIHRGGIDPRALAVAAHTCEAMARGGMYDQLAGGFARYSVDGTWTVPHFEKMLYDNALLLGCYADWWAATQDPLAHRVCAETAEFLLRDLLLPTGGFAAALDADAAPAPGGTPIEGASYVWRPEQVAEVLEHADADWVTDLCGITEHGTFEAGGSVLQLRRDPDDWDRWNRCRAALLEARNRRPQPLRDDKVVTAWNALAVSALVRAGVLLDNDDWLALAVGAGEVLRDRHLVDGRLRRVSRSGRVGAVPAMLTDYALTAHAFLDLQRASGDDSWFVLAERLTGDMVRFFCVDPEGEAAFYDTPHDADRLVRRPRETSDGAEPSGTAAAARTLMAMAAVSGRTGWRDLAEHTLQHLAPQLSQHPRFSGWALQALLAAAAGPLEVAVIPAEDDAGAARHLLAAAERLARGRAVIVVGGDGAAEGAVPLLQGRRPARSGAEAHVCRRFTCDLPARDIDALAAAMAR
jgi:hypothetical protein